MDELRLTLFEEDGIHCELEIYNGLPFLHCTVTKWSKTKYLEFLNYWELTKLELEKKGIDFMFCVSTSPKTTKFAEMFGFKIVSSGSHDLLFMRWRNG